MKNSDLTALWREAGKVWTVGMRGRLPEGGPGFAVHIGTIGTGTSPWHASNLMGSTDDLVPDWDDPVTVAALTCIAEDVVGEPLLWVKRMGAGGARWVWVAVTERRVFMMGGDGNGGYGHRPVCSPWGFSTKAECALRTILKGKAENDAD